MKLHGKGKSSFALIDRDPLADMLRIEPGVSFLDLGCGSGAYTLFAAELAGDRGAFLGMDLWDEGVEELAQQARKRGLASVTAKQGDITAALPVPSASIDRCLLSTVLHDIGREHPFMLDEVRRVLRPDGRVIVIEFEKKAATHGPPLEVRLSPQEVQEMCSAYGLQHMETRSLGEHLYAMAFGLKPV